MLDILTIDYGNGIGIRYAVVDKEKTGKEFIVKEFEKHKDALNYTMELNKEE